MLSSHRHAQPSRRHTQISRDWCRSHLLGTPSPRKISVNVYTDVPRPCVSDCFRSFCDRATETSSSERLAQNCRFSTKATICSPTNLVARPLRVAACVNEPFLSELSKRSVHTRALPLNATTRARSCRRNHGFDLHLALIISAVKKKKESDAITCAADQRCPSLRTYTYTSGYVFEARRRPR